MCSLKLNCAAIRMTAVVSETAMATRTLFTMTWYRDLSSLWIGNKAILFTLLMFLLFLQLHIYIYIIYVLEHGCEGEREAGGVNNYTATSMRLPTS